MIEHTFTSDQQIGFDGIKKFIERPNGGICLLQGPAGSGKTHLISRIVKHYKDSNLMVTSPTHKSNRVLRTECDMNYRKVRFATIHSALGLREKIDGHGKLSFVADKKQENKLSKYSIKILIVDEVSMLYDELFDDIVKLARRNLKVIFVGDALQIPPVNYLNAKPFDANVIIEHNIELFELNEIVRQAKGNPIITLATHIRENIDKVNALPSDLSRHETEKGLVEFISKDEANKLYDSYFNTDKFKERPDHAKILAWTNRKVNKYNDYIRNILFKGHVKRKIHRGEKLVIDAPILKKNRIILHTNDEVEVINYEIKYEQVTGLEGITDIPHLKYYETTIKYDTQFFGHIQYKIDIIHEDSEKDFNKVVNMLSKVALKEKQGSDTARYLWLIYYDVKDHFAKIKHIASSTIHKAQGSTHDNVIVDLPDILKNKNITERNRLLYTAITRARFNLHIIQ